MVEPKRKKRRPRNSRHQSTLSPQSEFHSTFARTTQSAALTQEKGVPEARAVWGAAWIALAGVLIVGSVVGGYTLYLNRPALGVNVVIMSWGKPHLSGDSYDKNLSVAMYVALTNNRDIPISPVDYKLNVKRYGVRVPMMLDYQVDKMQMDFADGTPIGVVGPAVVTFPDRRSLLTHDMTESTVKGKPRYGLLWFRSVLPQDSPVKQGEISSWELTVLDSTGRTYEATTASWAEDFRALYSYEPNMVVQPVRPRSPK